MNEQRIKHFIKVMEEVERKEQEQPDHTHFNMGTWADKLDKGFVTCNTVACALGWLAISKEANDEGLYLKRFQSFGTPIFISKDQRIVATDEYAGADYLEISVTTARTLFFPVYYNHDHITPRDVINKLEKLLEYGEAKYLEM